MNGGGGGKGSVCLSVGRSDNFCFSNVEQLLDPRNGKKKEANYRFWGLRTICTGFVSRPAPETVKNMGEITISGIRRFTV